MTEEVCVFQVELEDKRSIKVQFSIKYALRRTHFETLENPSSLASVKTAIQYFKNKQALLELDERCLTEKSYREIVTKIHAYLTEKFDLKRIENNQIDTEYVGLFETEKDTSAENKTKVKNPPKMADESSKIASVLKSLKDFTVEKV